MHVKNVTAEKTSFTSKMMQSQAPNSHTDYLEIDHTILFVRTYDLTNENLPFYLSFSQQNNTPVSDESINKILYSELVRQKLLAQYNITKMVSENNVTHIFPTTKKQGGKANVIS